MTSTQYEEICRRFIADQYGLRLEDVRSVKIPNPKRPDLPTYEHQIDLYWEVGNNVAVYLNIANAKWRADAKVEQGEVLLLQQVRHSVGAHKAFMITTIGFTAGALAAAVDHGIALHVVSPAIEISALPNQDTAAIQEALSEIAVRSEGPLYHHEVVYRGIEATESANTSSRPSLISSTGSGSAPIVRTTAVPAAPTNRSIASPSRGDFGGGGRGFGPSTKK